MCVRGWDGFKISSLGLGTTQVDMWLSSPTGYRYWSSFLNICGDGLSNMVCACCAAALAGETFYYIYPPIPAI